MSKPETCRICFKTTDFSSEGCPCYGDGSAESELDCFRLGVKARDEQLSAATARASELERELTLLKGKRFPVLSGGMTVPWQMLAPHEPQAYSNHTQTLQRLAERGGLSWAEVLCVLESRSWGHDRELTDEQAKPKVLALVAEYERRGTDGKGEKNG
jgi:hypothetical protein